VIAAKGLTNFWGYDTIGFFALHSSYFGHSFSSGGW
jgi:pullulanase/glycogen debranching enzyme